MSNNLSDLLDFIYLKIKCTITYVIEMVFERQALPFVNPNNCVSYSPIVEQLVLCEISSR
jgi:hypothetical protein